MPRGLARQKPFKNRDYSILVLLKSLFKTRQYSFGILTFVPHDYPLIPHFSSNFIKQDKMDLEGYMMPHKPSFMTFECCSRSKIPLCAPFFVLFPFTTFFFTFFLSFHPQISPLLYDARISEKSKSAKLGKIPDARGLTSTVLCNVIRTCSISWGEMARIHFC